MCFIDWVVNHFLNLLLGPIHNGRPPETTPPPPPLHKVGTGQNRTRRSEVSDVKIWKI